MLASEKIRLLELAINFVLATNKEGDVSKNLQLIGEAFNFFMSLISDDQYTSSQTTTINHKTESLTTDNNNLPNEDKTDSNSLHLSPVNGTNEENREDKKDEENKQINTNQEMHLNFDEEEAEEEIDFDKELEDNEKIVEEIASRIEQGKEELSKFISETSKKYKLSETSEIQAIIEFIENNLSIENPPSEKQKNYLILLAKEGKIKDMKELLEIMTELDISELSKTTISQVIDKVKNKATKEKAEKKETKEVEEDLPF
ncbi:MAG: hypothetical protein QXS19_04295 [Candidatus Methanomethylicia archaeon]